MLYAGKSLKTVIPYWLQFIVLDNQQDIFRICPQRLHAKYHPGPREADPGLQVGVRPEAKSFWMMKIKSNLKLICVNLIHLKIDNINYHLFYNDLSLDLVYMTNLVVLNYNLSKSNTTLKFSHKHSLSTSTKGVKRLNKKEREKICLTDKEKEVLVGPGRPEGRPGLRVASRPGDYY